MPTSDPCCAAAWRKSSLSGTQNHTNCVEVAPLDRQVALRDSKDPDGPALTFPRDEWTAFIAGVRRYG